MLPEQILSITGVNKPGMFPCDPAVISALIDVLPLRLYVKDLERRFTYANKATIDAHKMGSMDQILGKKDEDFLGARSAEEARIDEEVLLSTGVPVLDKEVLDDWRDGVSTWSLVCKKPIVNDSGQIVGLLGMSKDITATKKDQIRFKLAVDSSGEGLWHRNLITGETWFSDRMMEIYGYDPQRIPSEVSRWRAVHPKHRKEVAARLRDCIEGRTPKYDCQFQVRGSDGAYRWIQARGVVLRFESKAVEFAGAHADITATKNLELSIASRLQESLARLAQEQQTFNLSRIAIELSHDFKTLIHGALIQLPVVISKLARKTAKAEEVVAALESTIRACKRNEQEINNLINKCRSQAFTPVRCDVHACLGRAQNIVSHLGSPGLGPGYLDNGCDRLLPDVFVDPFWTAHALVNILQNAAENCKSVVYATSRMTSHGTVAVDINDDGSGFSDECWSVLTSQDALETRGIPSKKGSGVGLINAVRNLRRSQCTVEFVQRGGDGGGALIRIICRTVDERAPVEISGFLKILWEAIDTELLRFKMLELSSVCVFENVLPNASIPHGDPGWLRYICGCTLRYFVNSSESTLLSPTYSASNIVSGLVFSADDGAFTAEELASINSPIAQTMAHGMSKPAANDIEGVRQALTVFAARYPACRAVATNLTRGRSIHLSFS